ncbi:GlxA family transcriptional regulator [Aquisalimonas asiatica]|uniref:Transcriptional regulator, AraC family with amidase-like domain n=1 Tax=Aquisalimonas asiatica TaxID=406100 RepID=A0A1H8UUX2_9GAMM|nr:GlxA family transcriptional regulator [Aquisalimonas asiatica]SEP06989.1 transcriptional regulator, AraC family with amidase-like domain [Aquisalimonas asiatica]
MNTTDRGSVTSTPRRIGFLMIPGFSQMAFSSALEPLRMANQLTEKPLYSWHMISRTGEPVAASNGLSVTPETGLREALDLGLDMALVCSGVDVQEHIDRDTLAWLSRLARRHVPLGSVCTGGYILARAGVLNGYRCTLHWEHISSIHEALLFPDVEFCSELFVLDRDRYTCSGGVAPLDMMLTLIAREHGADLAERIAEEFLHERIRDFTERQRTPLKVRLGTSQPKLVEVVTLMEANLHEPLTLDELASHARLSRRQLERLFQRHLGCPPTRYYMDLRLARARQLLLQTEMPITDVALACGFVSPPHFTKCYHERQGRSPSEERRLRRQRLVAGAAPLHAQQPAALVSNPEPVSADSEFTPLEEAE